MLRFGPVAAVDLHGEPGDVLPPGMSRQWLLVPETREINGGMSSGMSSPGSQFWLLMLLHVHCRPRDAVVTAASGGLGHQLAQRAAGAGEPSAPVVRRGARR